MSSEPSLPNLPLSSGLAFGASIALFLFILNKYWSSSRRLPYPPGPRPLPIVGNLFDMPQAKFALTWTKMGNEYGPLTWLTVPSQTFLILNSMEAAKELLEQRGSIYVDRPRFVFLGELIGANYVTSLCRYNPMWRKHRSLLKHALSPQVVKRDYSPLLMKNAEQYLHCLVKRPKAFLEDLKRTVAESIVTLTYGRLRDEQDRDYIQLNSYVVDTSLKVLKGHIVDLIPALRHIPSWVPGMKFKRDAAIWRHEFHEITRAMFERAKESVISGEADGMSSFMTNNLRDLYRKQQHLNNGGQLDDDETAISHSGFTFFLGGVESSQYSIHSFLLAMVLFPSVQEKARLEIDRVVGDERLPTLDDQQDMPYFHAVVLEIFRWNPVFPVGLPHASLKDDIYDGYFIPKGTAVLPNAWGISRNTKYYNNPSIFDPDRYLKSIPELDPRQFVFGFGRRICPGNELAFQVIWLMAASILWSFRLESADGDTSLLHNDIDRFSLEFMSEPAPFKCEFLPRRDNLQDILGLSME